MKTKPSCPNCGADIEVERKGHYEVIHCIQCQWHMESMVFPGEEIANIGSPQAARVRIDWEDGHVTAKQVAAAKKIIPKLHDKSLSSMMQEFASSPTYDLGVYPEWSAKELQEKAGKLGLKLVIEPIKTAGK